MSGTMPNTKVIPLPFPQPFRSEGGAWSRTWKLSMCSPIQGVRLRELEASLAQAGFDASIEHRADAELDVTIHYTDQDPYSDENFVVRPREMLRTVEAKLGRIALIEGVARTLWPPFRPAFSLVVSTFEPALILEKFVRILLSQKGWEAAAIVLPNGEIVQPAAVNFAGVRELDLKQSPADGAPEIQVVVVGDDLALLASEDSPSFGAQCELLETVVDDQFTLEMALAS